MFVLQSRYRADKTFIVNELCQRMSNPTQQSFAKFKRPVRHLKRERLWAQIHSYGRMVEEVTTHSNEVATLHKMLQRTLAPYP